LLWFTKVVQRDYDEHAAADAVSRWFSRLDVLVVGPGLGRDPLVIRTVAEIIRRAREVNLPLVIDADGLYVVTQQPELVRGYEVRVCVCVAYERRQRSCTPPCV